MPAKKRIIGNNDPKPISKKETNNASSKGIKELDKNLTNTDPYKHMRFSFLEKKLVYNVDG